MRNHAQTTFSDTDTEIAEAVDFVVHVERQPGRRILREVLAIRGHDRDAKRFLIEPVFEVNRLRLRDLKSYLEHNSTALVSALATGSGGAEEPACPVQDDTVRIAAVRAAGEGVQHNQLAGGVQLEYHALTGSAT
jgi:hypothetical protein